MKRTPLINGMAVLINLSEKDALQSIKKNNPTL